MDGESERVRRLYRLEGLQLRMRVRRRKHIALHRGPAPVPIGHTERWSMDFVHDALADGRQFSRDHGRRSVESL
jgi:putative transposase